MSYLLCVQARLAANQPVLDIVTDIRLGATVHGIQEALVQRRRALVIMTTHGRGGAARTLIGSVAGKIVQLGTVPVALIHSDRADNDDVHLPITLPFTHRYVASNVRRLP